MELGKYHTLEIVRDTSSGLFLKNEEDEEVLLPGKFVPKEFNIGDDITVFIYLDNSGRPIATTQEAYAQVGDFALLYCADVSSVGAFMDMGIDKELFVPFANQRERMEAGTWYVVRVLLDGKTNRLVGTSKLKPYLDNKTITVNKYDRVEVLVSHFSDFGAHVIINGLHEGLIHKEVIFEDLRVGDKIEGFIKRVKEDGKIDVLLQPEGYKSIEPNAQYILDELKENKGFLPLNDKSDPTKIQEFLGMSKKSFKKAIGSLYKERNIIIESQGIRLKED